MAKVRFVKRSRAVWECGKCRARIPVGEGYFWWKPRYGSRKVRCEKPECRFTQADTTTSKMAEVYSAIDDATSQINDWDGESSDDLQSVMEECASAVRAVADEYESAAEAMNGAGESHQEKADELNSFADELENIDFPDKPEVNCCEHGDHKAPDGERFCSDSCKKCEGTDAPEGQECANLCKPDEFDEDSEPEGLDDWQNECRTACTDALGNVPG